jgi:hypothetical protein
MFEAVFRMTALINSDGQGQRVFRVSEREAPCIGYLGHLFGEKHCKCERAYLHWLQIDVQLRYNGRAST